MKKLMTIIAAVLCIGWSVVSCTDPVTVDEPVETREDVTPKPVPDSVTFTVTLEQGNTKTSLNGTQILWSAGDKIKVFNASNLGGVEYTLSGDGGEATGKFSGPALSGTGPFYAVYPSAVASSATDLGGGSLSLNLAVPATQTCAASDDALGAGANVSAGRSDALDAFTFKNVFGILQLTVSDAASVSSVMVYTKGESDVLNGAFTLSFQEGTPVATPVAGQADEDHQKLTLVCGTSTMSNRVFSVVVPAGTLDAGMTIELHDSDGLAQVKNAGAYTSGGHFINRSHIRPMPVIAYRATYASSFLTSPAVNAVFFDIDSPDATMALCYDPATSQYAYNNDSSTPGSRYIRIQDWSAGYAMDITLSPFSFEGGNRLDADMNDYGNLDTDGNRIHEEGYVRVLKKTVSRFWLVGEEGYALEGGILMNITD